MHGIDQSTGRAAMAYVGQMPWHGLGTAVREPMLASEAMRLGGLDWEVTKLPVYTMHDGACIDVPDTYAMMRTDTFGVLGTVGPGYTPIQNKECFAFMDACVGDSIRYHTVGSLYGGRKIWLLARIKGDLIVKDEHISKFLLLSTGHDGMSQLEIYFTPIRVVCANTLAMAQRGAGKDGFRMRHTRNIGDRIQQAQEALGLATRAFAESGAIFNAMAERSITRAQLTGYFAELWPDPEPKPDGKAVSNARVVKVRNRLLELFETGKGSQLPSARGTLYGAYNAVTEYLTHEMPVASKNEQENRLNANWFGRGKDMNKLALDTCINMFN